ncbi:MAG TPA: metal-dependent hydrolase [Candidatus Deferrimicrobiaceae bacterium]|nr:metal-dependent hydrolase [Candidatus Deferrimicrobiaceae bacterium]
MPPVKIRWFGHSGFSLQDPSGKTILIDPWFQGNPTAPSGPEEVRKADFLLLTHDHFDHAADAAALARQTGALVIGIFELIGDLKAKGVPESQLLHGGIGMNVGGTVVLDGFSFTMTEARHSCTLGTPVGYVIQTPSGLTVYHSGDTGIFSGMELIGELYPVDVALLPIGSVFTMDYRQAAKAAALLKAKTVIPMHFGTFPILEPNADRFVAEMKKSVPGTRVVVLSPGEETSL